MKLIPVVKVSRETIESILKSRVGLVQRQTWVKDGSGRKGHYRMQWVSPGEGKNASDYSKQLDLFGEPEPKKPEGDVPTFQVGKKYRHKRDGWEGVYSGTATMDATDGLDKKGNLKYKLVGAHKMNVTKPAVFTYAPMGTVGEWTGRFKLEDFEEIPDEAYKPKWPDKGEFAGNGLGDNGREYEGYRAKDGSTHFYDTETGREIGEDGEYLDKKKHATKAEGKPLIDQIKVTKVSKKQIEFEYQGETYALGARSDNPIALKTIQKDGKEWYNYGGKLGVTGEVSYGEKTKLEEALRKKYGKYDPEKQMYEFSDSEKGEKAKDKAGEYKIYHDTFTGVIDEVVNHLGKQGLYMAEDDVFHKIATGPGRPKGGRTDRYDIPLFTGEGKAAGKAVAFQVYDMDGKKFELNMYVSPMQKDLYESYYDDPVQVRKPNEPEKPAGGDKDFKAAQEWLFKNKYFGEDRVNHSKTHELVDRMERAGVLTDDLKKKLVNLDTQAILNNKDSNEDEKKWAQATIESAKKGDIDPAVILSAVSGGLFVMGEYVPKKDLPKESIESANILASAIMEMVNKPKESESPTGRKNLAIQTLMDGGKFRKRLEKDRYTGREKFKVRLIDRYGNEVPGVAEATMIELRESGKIKRDRDAVYGSSANEEWVIDQDSGKGPNPVKKSIIERFRNGLAKAFWGE